MFSKIKPVLGVVALTILAGCVVATEEAAPPPASTPPAAATAPMAGSATDLTAFEGARAGQAEMGIQNLGYEPIRTDGLTTWWFNRETGACARITTADGRYSDVTMLPAGDC
jgi:hypothetical protein